jgi:hypothetical protein
MKRLMHRNIIGEAQTERPPRAAVSPKSYQMFLSGGCNSSGILSLPAPPKQTQGPEAGGEEWEGGRERRWVRGGVTGNARINVARGNISFGSVVCVVYIVVRNAIEIVKIKLEGIGGTCRADRKLES